MQDDSPIPAHNLPAVSLLRQRSARPLTWSFSTVTCCSGSGLIFPVSSPSLYRYAGPSMGSVAAVAVVVLLAAGIAAYPRCMVRPRRC
jgi:hypothetical protein